MAVSVKGVPVALEPKTFDVLSLLIEHRDRLVTKDELLDAVWRDTFVTPNVLTRAVAQLRRALGDDAHDARYIETAAKRGYRFIAPITPSVVPTSPADAGPAAIDTSPAAAAAAPSSPRPFWPTRGDGRLAIRPAHVLLAAGVTIGIVATIWLARRTTAAPATGSPPLLRRLTTRVGANASPAISPDGSAVAYASDRTGALEIHVVGLATGSHETAVTSDGGQNLQPEWSPDGKYLAFHSRKRGGIWIAPSTGGAPRQIAEFGSEPSWSPDGERLAFSSDAGGMASQSLIWTVRRDGTNGRPLTTLGNPPGGHRAPSWSRDGQYVVFAVSQGGWRNEIWIVPAAGGGAHHLATTAGATDPRFSLDGQSIYWGGATAEGNGRLWRLPIDARTGEAHGAPQGALWLDNGSLDGLSIANDGTAVVGLVTEDANLWAIDLTPAGDAKPPVRLTEDAVRDFSPDYSTTGRLVFLQVVVGRPTMAWLMNADGSAREPLLSDDDTWSPHWNADGSRVFASLSKAGDKPVLSWIDVATRRTTPIALPMADVKAPRPSPDGREVAFHVIQPDGVMNVWTQPLDGRPRRRVTSDAEAISYPIWSPDGKSLAVEIKRGDQTRVGVVSRDGGAVAELTSERGQSWPNSWSPDGEWIAFAGQRDGVWNIWKVSRRTRESRQLTHFTSANEYVRYPTWSPDGARIVFERNVRTGGVWTVNLK